MSSPAAIALALPDVEQGVSCAGTALESQTFLVRKKAFLFVSKEHLRLKLQRSMADAEKRGFEVGAGGWTRLDLGELPAQPILKAWIAESHSLFAGGEHASAASAKSKSQRRPKR